MGQQLGKSVYIEECRPFLNLPQSALNKLLETFNNVAEGFGLNPPDFQDVCACLIDYVSMTETELGRCSKRFFEALDTDNNSMVDALEFLGTVAITSSISIPEKLSYIFMLYDFDENSQISLDEMTLCLKSTITGLCKITNSTPPPDLKMETYTLKAFTENNKERTANISKQQFIDFCLITPEISTWLVYFNNPDDTGEIETTIPNADFIKEITPIERTEKYEEYIDSSNRLNISIKTQEKEEKEEEERQKQQKELQTNKQIVKKGHTYQWITSPLESTNEYDIDDSNTGDIPTTSLNIEWIYGWNCQKSRNILYYLQSGELIYPAACIIVLYNPSSNTQRYFNQHNEQVTAMTVNLAGNIVASSQAGKNPKIIVWKTDTLEILSILSGYQHLGISSLSFSQNGIFLTSISQETPNKVVVYAWQSKNTKMIFSAESQYKIYSSFWKNDESFGTVGENGLFLWFRENHIFLPHRTYVGNLAKIQDQTCISCTPDRNYYITGTISGDIYIWENRNIKQIFKGHDGAVMGITMFGSGFLSVGKDDKVRVWGYAKGARITPGSTYEIGLLNVNYTQASNISIDPTTSKIAVGTFTGSIFEMSFIDGSNINQAALVQSHCDGQLKAMEMIKLPSQQQLQQAIQQHSFVTGGDDGIIYLWDYSTHNIVKTCRLNGPITSMSISQNGKYLIVGFGYKDGKNHRRTGNVVILEFPTFKVLKEMKDSAKPITCVAWGDNTSFGIASADHSVFIYDIKTENDGKLTTKCLGRCKGMSTDVITIDFNEDVSIVRFNTVGKDLLYFNTKDCSRILDASIIGETKWLTNNCLFHYSTKGLFQTEYFDNNIVTCMDKSISTKTCIFGTEYGEIRVTNFPVSMDDIGVCYYGHCYGISNIKYNQKYTSIFSTGKNDCCIIQWKNNSNNYHNKEMKQNDLSYVIQEDYIANASIVRPKEYEMMKEYDSSEKYKLNKLGDEKVDSIPIYPWMNSICPPTMEYYSNPDIPVESLELEWIYGYNNEGMKNNIFLSSKGEAIYPASSVVIIYDYDSGIQRFYRKHTDRISALSVDETRTIAASSQIGKYPKILIWNIETLQTIQELTGFHINPVRQLKFSPDNRFLASVEMDKYNTLAIYNIKEGVVQCSAELGIRRVMDFVFVTSDLISICGINLLCYGIIEGRNLCLKNYQMCDKGFLQPLNCITALGDRVVAGAIDGKLYVMKNTSVQRIISAHSKSILTISSNDEHITSASIDGLIKSYNNDFEIVSSADIKRNSFISNAAIIGLCPHDGSYALVGTRSGEIVELYLREGSLRRQQPLVQSHYINHLNAIASDPTKLQFATVGDDGYCRIFNPETHTQVKSINITNKGNTVCFSSDSSKIIVGLSERKLRPYIEGEEQLRDPSFMIINVENGSREREFTEVMPPIYCIKCSESGDMMAVSSAEHYLYVYDVKNDYQIMSKCESMNNTNITHFDLTENGGYLQCYNTNNELVFYQTENSGIVDDPSSMKDMEWTTYTIPGGYCTQGIWPEYNDGTVYNNIDRSKLGKHLVTCDNYGQIKLYNFPVLDRSSSYKVYRGHSGEVSDVKFLFEDKYVISIGKEDRCIFQWKTNFDIPFDISEELPLNPDHAVHIVPRGNNNYIKIYDMDISMSDRRWISNIMDPDKIPEINDSIPNLKVTLDFVHGFNTENIRSNLRYNNYNEIIYHTSRLGVIYNKEFKKQTYHMNHENTIISLDINDKGTMVITGEEGIEPMINIWNSHSGTLINKLKPIHEYGVIFVRISSDNHRIVSVGNDINHTIVVWYSNTGDWNIYQIECLTNGSRNEPHFISFLPITTEYAFTIGGDKYIKFYKIENNSLISTDGMFNISSGRKQQINTGTIFNGNLVTGTQSGSFYIWNLDTCILQKIVKAHERSITCVYSAKTRDHEVLVSGCIIGMVLIWNTSYTVLRAVNINDMIDRPLEYSISSVCINYEGTVLVGCKSGEIYEITCTGNDLLIHRGHSNNELWGLDMNIENTDEYITSGDDCTVRIWSLSQHTMKQLVLLDSKSRAVKWSYNLENIIVGLGGSADGKAKKDGSFLILEGDSLLIKHEGRDSREWITDIKYSKNGEMIAISSYDHRIYLYDTTNYLLLGRCEYNNSPVTHFDFSIDSLYIRTNSGTFDLEYFKTDDCEVVNHVTSVNNLDWFTESCPLTWTTQGIWPDLSPNNQLYNVNCCDCDTKHNYIIIALECGGVRIYHFPCIHKNAQYLQICGTNIKVQNIRFSTDFKYIIGVGGADRSIYQWKIEIPDETEVVERKSQIKRNN